MSCLQTHTHTHSHQPFASQYNGCIHNKIIDRMTKTMTERLIVQSIEMRHSFQTIYKISKCTSIPETEAATETPRLNGAAHFYFYFIFHRPLFNTTDWDDQKMLQATGKMETKRIEKKGEASLDGGMEEWARRRWVQEVQSSRQKNDKLALIK